LLARGVELVREDPDLILADAVPIEGRPVACPMIVYERCDGGMLWWNFASHGGKARVWLKSPQILGMMKITTYTHPRYYNQDCAEDAYHIEQVYAAAADRLPRPDPAPPIVVGEKDWRKIEIGYGFWAFRCCDPMTAYRIDDAEKDLDVVCAMTMDYASPGVTLHRRLAMEKLEQLPGLRAALIRGRRLPLDDYLGLMRRARICVSPWGWGETTIRDYEAMFAGCVLIKPRTDFIQSWPVVDERHYVPCAVDFADLPEKIDHVRSHWQDFSEMRRHNRERLLDLRRPESLADRLADMVKRRVEMIA
jgi:hypothetical protein